MGGKWIKNEQNSTVAVFIHGVLSSNETAWRNKKGLNWPDIAAQDDALHHVDIYSFNYSTGFFSGTYRLGDVVSSLTEYFKLDDVLEYDNIVFVCHSMGGIVARKFVVESALQLKKAAVKIGLFLIASPSLGSEYANWLSPLAKLAKHSQADALRFSQTNSWLLDLDKEFLNLKESDELALFGKELVEDKFVVFSGIFREQVVPPESGARYFGHPFKVPGSDHFSIAKIENKNAIQHRLFVDFVDSMEPEERLKNIAKEDNFEDRDRFLIDELDHSKLSKDVRLEDLASIYEKMADEFDERFGGQNFDKVGFANLLKMIDADDRITSENAAAIVMALVQRETMGQFVPIKTPISPAAKERTYGHLTNYGQWLGNEIEGDGLHFEPRGYVALTGRSKYKEVGEKIGVDLINDPEKMMDQRIAFEALMIEVSDTKGFQGRNLLDDVKWNSIDFRKAFTNVNGTALGAAEMERFTNQFLELFANHRKK